MKRVLVLSLALMGCGSLDEIDNPFDGDDKVEITAEKGEKGDPGPKGDKGDPGQSQTGAQGEQGPQGPAGENGRDGQNGKDGEDGQDGRNGEDGQDGRDGVDGQDGRDGVDGQPCTVTDHGTYVEILCPNSEPVRIDRPQNQDPVFTICVWIDWCNVQTLRNVPLSDINGGVYDIAHLGQCKNGR